MAEKKAQKSEKKNGVVQKTKEVSSELKKVTWPTFAKTLKTTGVVIGVVVLFTLVLFGIDRGFSYLYELLVKAVK